MERSVPSSTLSNLVRDIDCLASCITNACEDGSVEPQARAVAQYMLLCKRMCVNECVRLFTRPGAKRLFDKLLDCESEFMGPTPRAFGIDIVVHMTAGKFQQSLDVKQHQKTNDKVETCLDRITPKLKNNILFHDNDFMWVRVHCARLSEEECTRPFVVPETRTFKRREDVDKYIQTRTRGVREYTVLPVPKQSAAVKRMNKTRLADTTAAAATALRETRGVDGSDDRVVPFGADHTSATTNLDADQILKYEVVISNAVKIFKVCDRVYEIYVFKTTAASNTVKLDALLARYGTDSEYSLIFCSELKYFAYSPLLFISNYVKFTYCYSMFQEIFNPTTYEEIKAMTLYLSECALFMSAGNLANMPTDTHGPLIAYTGERPKVLLSKFRHAADHAVHTNEGTRAMQTTDKCSDLGARSHYVEVVTKISLDPSSTLRDII